MTHPGARARPSLARAICNALGETAARTRRHGVRSGRYCLQTFAANALIRLGNRFLPERVKCPCCAWSGHAFRALDVGQGIDYGVVCHHCRRMDRHRFLKLLFERRPPAFMRDGVRILYIAPEWDLDDIIRFTAGQKVVFADFDRNSLPDHGMRTAIDLTGAALRDEAFDGVVCIHVLEHIPEDSKAVSEILRMLRPGGEAVVMVPFSPFTETIEFGEPNPQLFGHVRDYAEEDFADRLAGLKFERIAARDFLSSEERKTYSIREKETVFLIRK
jgi:SAM-dependent methyltransferase